jgi:predicted RecB family nuclease
MENLDVTASAVIPMLITEDIFSASLACETKSYLKVVGTPGDQSAVAAWQRQQTEEYARICCTRLRAHCRADECLVDPLSLPDLHTNQYRLVIGCTVQAQGLQAYIHALERLPAQHKTMYNVFIPIRCVPGEQVTQHDKLLLAFDALVFSATSGQMPLFGKIIYGRGQKTMKVALAPWMPMTQAIVERMTMQHASPTPPPLLLNRHCAACEYQSRCRQIALEKDDLSLLSSLTEKERRKQHDKGIFTVTQLSYTFRPRRKPKRFTAKPAHYHHALKALAIRTRKIHIVGTPALPLHGTPVYLDVEGVPDREFYYLIGVRTQDGDACVQHAFWANDVAEEQAIWSTFLRTLSQIDTPQLIHYGSYETTFLKRMQARYGDTGEGHAFVNQLLAQAVNLLSVIYAQIYFPTYSNGLKEIAQYLGFRWSVSSASGLKALMWRSVWESTHDAGLQQQLITYNAEDCAAAETVAMAITQLCQRQMDTAASHESSIVHVDTLKREYPQHFGRIDFAVPELAHINQAAYWDYQREKIYVRSSPRLKRVSRQSPTSRAQAPPVNKVIACASPACCPQCHTAKFYKHGRYRKIRYDLKFTPSGIKRWTVQYCGHRYHCDQCGATFWPEQWSLMKSRFGPGLVLYVVYQTIELKVPQLVVGQGRKQLYGLDLNRTVINHLKARAAKLYTSTYDQILSNIARGSLLQADETHVTLAGGSGYVWVFTTLEDVVFYYTATREGDFLHTLFGDFKGVLVSDFYAAYDAMNCPQQKCLIHLMRDMNDDLHKQPFNTEFKELVQAFAGLLRPMIETIDRFGLKAYFLRKHKSCLEQFYTDLRRRDYQSEVALKYKKRFEKNRDKLFTFLDYDNVPWNNNNAEHAVKAFVRLRDVIKGSSSEKGIRDYLILLSISETCKYKGVEFLQFLRSGEKDVDTFVRSRSKKH